MLTQDDLNQLADRLERYIDKRADGMDQRLDVLNGRTRQAEIDIAVLQDRTPQNPKRDGGIFGALGGIMAGFLAGWLKG